MEASASKSASKAGKSSGSGFAAGLLGSLKIPALAVGGAITGGIGYAVTKGIARLTAIDDAKAKLIGLGHDAQSVTQIMDSATAAVKGTSFGLDEAATAAATAVAAGVKPGEELTKYLTGIADAAAIAGTPLEEMAPIFNKVTTNGKAMTGELQQLSDRGLPIFQWLQDEYKVSGEQLSKMVSDGKVDAATFQKVVSANIGGAAQKMGNSTSGALKNMNAAIGRFGAALVAPVFNKAAGVFTFLTGAVDNATKAIGPLLERIGSAFNNFFNGQIMPFVQSAIPHVKEFFAGFQQYIPSFSSAVTNVGDVVKGALPKVLDVLKTVATTVIGVFKNLVTALQPFVSRLIGVVQSAYQGMAGLLAKIAPKLAPLGASIVKVFNALMPAVKFVGTVLGNVLGVIVKVVTSVSQAVLPVIISVVTWILDKLGGLIGWLTGTAFPAIGDFFKGVGEVAMWLWNNAIVPAFDGIKAAIGIAWQAIQAALIPFKLAFEAISFVVKLAWAAIQIVFRAMGLAFNAVGQVASDLWQRYMVPAWEGIKSAISAAWEFISPVWDGIKTGARAVGEVAMWLWNNAITPAWDGIKSAFGTAWDFISGIFEKIKSGFGIVGDVVKGIASTIGDAVKTAFGGLADLIKKPLHALGDFLASIPGNVLGVDIPGASTVQGWGKSLQGLATGGVVRGPGTGTSDSILAWLSNGEGVVTARGMANGGATLVAALNNGWVPPVEMVRSMVGSLPGFAEGLNPGADFLRNQIMQLWPQITSIGGRRSEDGFGEHSSGNAIDVMIPSWDTPGGKALGDAVASFVSKNADALGLDGFIWRQTSYGYGGSLTSGKAMGDRGSPTQNHMDHVHVMLGKGRGAGAPAVNAPTASLSMPSGSSLSPGSGRSGHGATAKQIQTAQNRVADLENRVQRSQMALDEAQGNDKIKPSVLKGKQDALEKNKRDLEQAKTDLETLKNQPQNVSGAKGSGSDSNNPFVQITKGIGQLADMAKDGLLESLPPPGFNNPLEGSLLKSGAGVLNFISGLTNDPVAKGILGMASQGMGGSPSGVIEGLTSLLPSPFGGLDGTWGPDGFVAAQQAGTDMTPSPDPSTYAPDPAMVGAGQTINNDNSTHIAEGGTVGMDPVSVFDKTQRQQRANQNPQLGTRRF
nr:MULTISPECIES: tape measure protein [unclassified Mycolicibacterium]